MRRLVFLARHGETDWNSAGRWQGHTDVPLNERGRGQARELAARLKRARIAAVVSSDLARARETAEIVAAELVVPVVYVDPNLRERGFGCFEGLTRTECEAQYPHHWRAWTETRTAPPGGEATEGVATRIVSAATRAATEAAGHEAPVLVITHGGVLRTLLTAITGGPIAPVPNVALYRLEYDGANLRSMHDSDRPRTRG